MAIPMCLSICCIDFVCLSLCVCVLCLSVPDKDLQSILIEEHRKHHMGGQMNALQKPLTDSCKGLNHSNWSSLAQITNNAVYSLTAMNGCV